MHRNRNTNTVKYDQHHSPGIRMPSDLSKTFSAVSETKPRLILTRESKLAPDEDITFLGQWSIDYSQSIRRIKELEAITLPYPFAQNNSTQEAYNYLQQVDKNLFPQVCRILDSYHQTQHSYRYWRILVGYWWREFIEIIYERYTCIVAATEALPEASIRVLPESCYITPYDNTDFDILYKDDLYNHQIYSQLIRLISNFDCEVLSDAELKALDFLVLPSLQLSHKDKLKKIFCFFSRVNRYYFASTMLRIPTLLKLSIYLCVFPTLDTHRLLPSTNRIVCMQQRAALRELSTRDKFETIISALLPQHFPKIYWEDLLGLQKKVSYWFPQRAVRSITTGNAFATNDGFKCFTATQVEKYRTPYSILQHGGHYGCGAWCSSEDYEKETADYYLTYGWNENNSHVKPFIVNRFHCNSQSITGKHNGNILWVLASFPRYSYTMYAVPSGPLFVDYLNEQAEFIMALSSKAKDILRCRAYRHQYAWHDIDYIQNLTNEKIQISNLKKSMLQEAKETRLLVCTYNATAHLEAFAFNIPTLIYWNPKLWPIRPQAQSLYTKLHDTGILHYSPQSAAQHIMQHFDNTLEWWQQAHIQSLRHEFCDEFAKTDPQYSRLWQEIITGSSPSLEPKPAN